MWQCLETKSRFIAQVMNGESDLRRIEDIDGAALTYAEVKAIASGNPLVIEKANIDAEVARLSRLRSQHMETQYRLRIQLRHAGDDIPRLEKRLTDVRNDMKIRSDTRGDAFSIQIDGQQIRDRGIAGELLMRHAERVRGARAERVVGHFAGFEVAVFHNFMNGPEIWLRAAGTYIANVGTTALGTIRSVEYVIQNLDESIGSLEARLAETRKRIADLQVQVTQPFEYESKLASLSVRQDEIQQALDLTKSQASAQMSSNHSDDGLVAEEPAITETATELEPVNDD